MGHNFLYGHIVRRTPTAFNQTFMRDVVSLSDKEMVALLDGRGIEKRGKRDQKFKNLFDNRHSTASYHVHKCFRKEPSAPSLTKKRQKRHFSDCCFGWWCCGSSFSCTKQQTVFDMTFLKIVTPIFFVVWRRRLLSLMSSRYPHLKLP